jgi:hypothetical protein
VFETERGSKCPSLHDAEKRPRGEVALDVRKG